MIACFIERMTVLGRGLVFQPVLVTHICTYNSNNIITLQNIDFTDFPSKKKNLHTDPTYPPPPPPPQTPPNPTTTTTKEVTILANVLTCLYN